MLNTDTDVHIFNFDIIFFVLFTACFIPKETYPKTRNFLNTTAMRALECRRYDAGEAMQYVLQDMLKDRVVPRPKKITSDTCVFSAPKLVSKETRGERK